MSDATATFAERDELVSVVIPCRDHAHYLAEAIESARAQTHRHVEVIVVDDASHDDTGEVARRYDDVRYIRHAKRRGLARARNSGLREARGEYVVFLDADDFLLPAGIEAGIACMDANPDLGFAFGFYTAVADDGRRLWDRTDPVGSEDIFAELLVRNVVEMFATAIFRRQLISDGGFDPALKACEDYDLLLRISRTHGAAEHPAAVACYRRHSDNMSHRYALMLRTSLQAQRKQKRFVQRDPAWAAKWAEGRRFWKLWYGSRLFNQAHAQLRTGQHVWRARWHLIVLVRHVGLGQVRAWLTDIPAVAEAPSNEPSS